MYSQYLSIQNHVTKWEGSPGLLWYTSSTPDCVSNLDSANRGYLSGERQNAPTVFFAYELSY